MAPRPTMLLGGKAVSFIALNMCRVRINISIRIAFYAADAFPYTVMTSSDDNGLPTAPTVEAISIFWGVQDNGDGTYTKVPEKLPPGPDGKWYRRSVPILAAELVELGVQGYLAHPVIFGSNSGEPNSFTGRYAAELFVAVHSHTPACLALIR